VNAHDQFRAAQKADGFSSQAEAVGRTCARASSHPPAIRVFIPTAGGTKREHTMILERDTIRLARGTGVILLIPVALTLLALWRWRPGALLLAVILLIGGVGLAYGLVTKGKLRNRAYRLAVGMALAAVLLLMWMNVAVGGILGDDPANMMYFGVLLVGFIGAVRARLEPPGMARALGATAFAMVLVPAIAWRIGTPAFANGVVAVFGLHAAFAALFVGSALLFRKAARGTPGPG
jgi:hypothetical protein